MNKSKDVLLHWSLRRTLLPLIFASACLCSCAGRHAVLAVTGTVIGVEISQNPANQSPQAKLGYNRGEIAIVPTNRSAQEEAGNANGGAKDISDVIMEIRYGGIFDTGPSSGIYQRLAVGPTAVQQPGAALMFGKDADGKIDANATAAIQSLKSVPAADPKIIDKMDSLSARRQTDPGLRSRIDAAVVQMGYASWDKLVDSKPTRPTEQQLDQLLKIQ